MCKAKYDTNNLRSNTFQVWLFSLFFFFSTIISSDLSEQLPGSFQLHLIRYIVFPERHSFRPWIFDHPHLGLLTILFCFCGYKRRRKKAAMILCVEFVIRIPIFRLALLSWLLPVLLRNFLVGRASMRRLFRDENNGMRVERWPLLVIYVPLLLPRLSRDHNDVSHFLLESSYLNNR